MKKILKNKYFILIPIIILNIISLLYLYKTPYFSKQLFIYIISFISLFIFSKVNYKYIQKFIIPFYISTNLLLLYVLIFGRTINGSKAWINIFNFSLQPSELSKISLITILSSLIIKKKSIITLIIITLIPSLLTFLEPDTGAIIIYIIILLSSLKYIKINKKTLLILSILTTLFITVNFSVYILNKELLTNIYGSKIIYRIERLISFKEQTNIQNTYSKIAIGSHQELYIPENHNDFIFASILSSLGPIPTIISIICLLLTLTYYIKNISPKKNTSNIINFMILNMLTFQIFYNILMNLSLTPIIGIPLPFLSYGGSYLITLYTIIGLSINLNIHFNSSKADNKAQEEVHT